MYLNHCIVTRLKILECIIHEPLYCIPPKPLLVFGLRCWTFYDSLYFIINPGESLVCATNL